MGDPIALGDTLPELVETLINTKFAGDYVCAFSARSRDYETFWVECYPEKALVEPSGEDWSKALWVSVPVKVVSMNNEDIAGASTIKLFPEQSIMVILDKYGDTLHRSSPINLITPSPFG